MMKLIQRSIAGEYAAEVLFFLFKVGESLLEPTLRMYIYDSVCFNHFPGTDVCAHLNLDPVKELIVQDAASRYMMYYKVLLNFPAMVMVLFCGAWSDIGGRKLPVILTCFGTCLSVIIYMLSDGVFTLAPYMPLILVGAAIRGIFGRSAVMTMAAHSYVSDYSAPERRTAKLSSLVATSHFGYLFGSIAAGVCLERFGFTTVFLTVIVIQTIVVLIAYVCMRDEHTGHHILSTPVPLPEDCGTSTPISSTRYSTNVHTPLLHHGNCGVEKKVIHSPLSGEIDTPEVRVRVAEDWSEELTRSRVSSLVDDSPLSSCAMKEDGGVGGCSSSSSDAGSKKTISSVESGSSGTGSCCCCYSLCQSFGVCLRPRKSVSRCTLLVLFIIVYIQQANKSGETDVLLLFSKRTPLNMSKGGYGYLLAASYASLGFFAFVVPRLMSWGHCTVRDTTLALVGSTFKIASLAIMATSETQIMLYIGCVIGGPQSLTISAAKSMISKSCCENDLGKAFSLLSSGETLANLVGTVIFTNLYSLTLPIYPGLAFLAEMGLYCLILLLFIKIAFTFHQNRMRKAKGLMSEKEGLANGYGTMADASPTHPPPHPQAVSAYISP